MKKLLAIALLLSGTAWAGTCGNGYGFSAQIRLQKASGSDQSNFPYPLVGTYSVLKTAANGGQVQNTANNALSVSAPADLVFCDAASAGNALKYEVAQYNGTTGTFEIWVLIPTLHSASNDSIYLFTDNPSVVTTQQDLTLWTDASYKSVYHLPDGSTLGAKDSTNTFNGTITSATAVAGQIDGAANINGGKIDTGNAQNIAGTGSIEAWVKPTSNSANCFQIAGNWNSPNGYGLWMNQNCAANYQLFSVTGNGGTQQVINSTQAMTANVWNYVGWTGTGTGTSNIHMYLQGVEVSYTGASGSQAIGNSAGNYLLGNDATVHAFPGNLDEVRLSTVVRSANWFATNYQVQSQQAPTFQVVGQTFSVPTIVNAVSCGTNVQNASASCSLPFAVTNGDTLVVAVSNDGSDCASAVSDSKGFTYTKQVEAIDNTTITSFVCIFTAPVTSAGVDTVSIFGTAGTNIGTWAYVYEIRASTLTGIGTASSVNDQPTTTTATAPNNNSILFCATLGQATTTTPNTYTLDTVLTPTRAGFGFSFLSVARGLVSSGSNSCSFDSGHGGALMILGDSPTVSKHRQSQVY